MMVALLAGCLIALQTPPAYPDRAKFLTAMASLAPGAASAEVTKVLGKPDRIVRGQHAKERGNLPDETWLYGTDGPNGAATLAQIAMSNGKVAYLLNYSPPPPTSIISEADLRRGLHLVLDSLPKGDDPDNRLLPTWVARSVNALLPFGEAKCKAIMAESARIMESSSLFDFRPYDLCFALFDPPSSPGYFDWGPVSTPDDPITHSQQPRWPLEIVNNVPKIHKAVVLMDGPVIFTQEFDRLQSTIHLRKTPLSLPSPVK